MEHTVGDLVYIPDSSKWFIQELDSPRELLGQVTQKNKDSNTYRIYWFSLPHAEYSYNHSTVSQLKDWFQDWQNGKTQYW